MATTKRNGQAKRTPVDETRDALRELADRLEQLDLERVLELIEAVRRARYGTMGLPMFEGLLIAEHDIEWAVEQSVNERWRRRMARQLRREAANI